MGEWIRGSDVLDSIKKGTRVWLFETVANVAYYPSLCCQAARIFQFDPCHLAWQVSEIPSLEKIASVGKTPASLPGR